MVDQRRDSWRSKVNTRTHAQSVPAKFEDGIFIITAASEMLTSKHILDSSITIFLLCLLLMLQLQFGDLRKCDEEFTKCKKKRWHHDAVCSDKKECIVMTEREFSFKVEAKMKPLNKGKETGKVPVSLWMRGSGPGLSWDKPVELRRSGSSVDSWRTEVKYRSSSDALLCASGEFCFANQKALEFRLYRDQMGKDDMVGPNFYAELPLSGSMLGSSSFLSPSLTVYPWFDGKEIEVRKVHVKSSLHVTGREGELHSTLNVLYPPSYEHNSRKRYPLVLFLGHHAQALVPLLEYAFVHEAHIQEAVVVGINPETKSPPYVHFSPYRYSHAWRCKKEPCVMECATCWLPKTKSACDKNEFIYQAKNCLKNKLSSSYGEQVLDFIEMDIVPKLRDIVDERLLVDFPKHRMTIFGELDGTSLLACHAALTRPHVYQNAACLSAPFYWPLSSSLTDPAPNPGILGTIRGIKKQLDAIPALQTAYISQKYYIDIAHNEHAILPLVDVYAHTDNFVQQLEELLFLERGKNILYFTVPDIALSYALLRHSTLAVYHRILPALKFFLRAEGGPNKDGARSRPVLDKTIAEQSELYGGLIGGGSNGSSVSELSSCDAYTTPPAPSRPTEVPIIFFLPILGPRYLNMLFPPSTPHIYSHHSHTFCLCRCECASVGGGDSGDNVPERGGPQGG